MRDEQVQHEVVADTAQAERQASGRNCTTTGMEHLPETREPCGQHCMRKVRRKAISQKRRQHKLMDSHHCVAQLHPARILPLSTNWVKKHKATVNDLKHLIAGGLSAIFSKTATAPFERVKMEMQLKQKTNTIAVAKELLTDAGFLTFWKGNGMNLIRVTPHKAMNFYCYSLYRTVLRKAMGGPGMGGIDKFIAGALAGSTATLVCFPLDVIRTRMLSKEGDIYSSARGTIKKMLREESLASFYVGCLPAICSTAASGAIFYGVYDVLKEGHLRRRQQRTGNEDVTLSAARTLLYGALAGAAAESMLYPLEVLRRRMQLHSMTSRQIMLEARHHEGQAIAAATGRGLFAKGGAQAPALQKLLCLVAQKPRFKQAFHATIDIYKVDGLPGFYQGFLPHILQVLPSAALSYYFYEACKRAMNVIDHQ